MGNTVGQNRTERRVVVMRQDMREAEDQPDERRRLRRQCPGLQTRRREQTRQLTVLITAHRQT